MGECVSVSNPKVQNNIRPSPWKIFKKRSVSFKCYLPPRLGPKETKKSNQSSKLRQSTIKLYETFTPNILRKRSLNEEEHQRETTLQAELIR